MDAPWDEKGMNSMNWQQYAACADADPEVFFPVGEPGTAGYEREVAEAKGYCARCPVRAACLTDAVEAELAVGVFGGTTPQERRPMQRASSFAVTGETGGFGERRAARPKRVGDPAGDRTSASG